MKTDIIKGINTNNLCWELAYKVVNTIKNQLNIYNPDESIDFEEMENEWFEYFYDKLTELQ